MNMASKKIQTDSDESQEESDFESLVTKKVKIIDYSELATVSSTSKTNSIVNKEKEYAKIKTEEEEEIKHEITSLAVNDLTNFTKSVPPITTQGSNSTNTISNSGGGAFIARKSTNTPNSNNSSINSNSIQKISQSSPIDLMSQIGNNPMLKLSATNMMITNSKKPSVSQAISNSNNQFNFIQNNGQNSDNIPNKESDMDFNLLLAYQQEQMKNQMLMNFLYQNMNNPNNNIENSNKIDLARLISQLGPSNNNIGQFGGVSASNLGSNIPQISSEMKNEYSKNEASSLLIQGQNSLLTHNGPMNPNSFQFQAQKNISNNLQNNNQLNMLLMNRGINIGNNTLISNSPNQLPQFKDGRNLLSNGNGNLSYNNLNGMIGNAINRNNSNNQNQSVSLFDRALYSMSLQQSTDMILNNKNRFNNNNPE